MGQSDRGGDRTTTGWIAPNAGPHLGLRWNSYVLERGGGFGRFWRKRLETFNETNAKALLVAGLGFDPRTPYALETLASCCSRGVLDLCLLNYDEGPDSVSQRYRDSVARNAAVVEGIIKKSGGELHRVHVPMLDDGRRVGGRKVGQLVIASGLELYRDVIVDISALPRTLYFPLLRSLLHLRDTTLTAGKRAPLNLHVVLCEAPRLDASIQEELTERADYLPGFGGTVDLEQDEDMPRVWSPVMGEGQGEALNLIFQKISITDNAPEICPVLPFPAVDPRRGDRLLIEYRRLLAAWRLDLRNIIYASENNPFDVYRQLCRLHDQYSRALRPLRGAKMIVSAHSSKLLSLGALLAAYDRPDVAVAHVEAQGYRVDADLNEAVKGELFEVWIAGEPYDV